MTFTTTATVTIDNVIQRINQDESVPELVSFSALLAGRSFAAVDNSGSTAGAPLRVAKSFVNAIGVQHVSLWNSRCNAPVPADSVSWVSTGGTKPHTVFEPTNHVPPDATCFIFMTDGMINNTTPLARHANATAHLPSLLILFGPHLRPEALVRDYNVSVVMAHFAAARTAAVIAINNEVNPMAYLIATKGDWSENLPYCPVLTDTLQLGECTQVSIHDLHQLPSRLYGAMDAGTLSLRDGRTLMLDALLNLVDGRSLLTQLTSSELEDIARAFLTSGRLPSWRQQLQRWLNQINQDASAQIEQAVRPASAGVHNLLRRLGEAETQEAQILLRLQLQETIHQETLLTQEAALEATEAARQPRAIVYAALSAVTTLEKCGMNATSLGRLSNRASRANIVDRNDLIPLSELEVDGAPEVEDLVLREVGPVALCLRVMQQPDHNTGDEALNQALRVGQFSENDVFEPTIVSLEIADRIEELDSSPLTRRRMSACLPIVRLSLQENRQAVFQRLCLVFMDELSLQHAWLIALSNILRTLERQPWAHPYTTDTGKLLSWFASQIMEHVLLPVGSRLSPNLTQPINVALASLLHDEALLIHSSIVETSVILRLVHRFGAPAAFSDADLIRSMQARIAAAIPQMHRNWLHANSSEPWGDQGPSSLTALVTSIYQTRVDANGHHVAIAGTGDLVKSLKNLIFPNALQAITDFAESVGIHANDLVTPGLSLVVMGTLDRVTGPHISSLAAVQAVRSSNATIAAEMNPLSVGTATEQDVLNQIRRRLAWARTPLLPLPPFSTPFGPSVFWFYCLDGTIVNMAEGFQTIPGEIDENFESYMLRLTEFLRVSRGRLMARFYGTQQTGAFSKWTTTTPMYREMADEYKDTDPTNDLSISNQASSFVHRVVQRLVGREGICAGNVYSVNHERNVALLLPSLMDSVALYASLGLDSRSEPRPVSLMRRVELELGTRAVEEILVSDPPNPIWVVDDDPVLAETLLRVQIDQERARASALRRRNTRAVVVSQPAIVATQDLASVGAVNLTRLQRSLTWFLRHGATSEIIRPDGFVRIEEVLASLNTDVIRCATVDDVLTIVETDTKGRFSVVNEDGCLLVRANQGHSISSVDPDQLMTLIENANDVPVCVHGTFDDAFQNILRSGGLNRMQRQAIQMAVGPPGDPEVRSGIHNSVDVVIYIDVERAMRVYSLRFYRSANNVICCAGPIPTDCFLSVLRLADGTLVDF